MSVAIRTATRLQDQDDVNVTPAVGVDEYALTYDHDTGKFVLRAAGGAPDLSGYALLAGRAGGQTLYGGTAANDDITIHGTSDVTRTTSYVILQPSGGNVGIGEAAPSQALDVIGSVEIQDTTTATTGVIFKGANRFIHNFHHPTGQTAIPVGQNLFIGVSAGNFTVGSTATDVNGGSNNSGLGFSALNALTSGKANVAVGSQSLLANTSGQHNVALGWTTLAQNTTGAYNMGVGTQALFGVVDTSGNVGIGYQAGRYRGSGTTEMTGEQYSIYIGYQARGFSDSDNNSVVIGGNQPIGLGSNTTVIGNTSTTAATLYGAGLFNLTGATTNAIVPMLTLTKNVTGAGVGAAGLGAGLLFQAESTTTDSQDQAQIGALWTTATHATRASALTFSTLTAGGSLTERMRIDGAGNVGIGTTAPATVLHVTSTTATTNALRNVLTLGANVTSTGVGAAGLGAAVLFTMETTTTADTSAASVQAIIYEATHATRKFDLVGNAHDTAIREGWRVRGNGSAPAIGFLGATPQARILHVADPAGGATVDAEARSAINSILATLENFGFHATS